MRLYSGETVRRNGRISIQSHGATHRRFSTLDGAEQECELRDSKAVWEAHIGEAATLFSFRHGDDGPDTAQTCLALLRTGYRAACLYLGDVLTAPSQPVSAAEAGHGNRYRSGEGSAWSGLTIWLMDVDHLGSPCT